MIDLDLFKNIMAEARHNSDLLDSFSPNQFKSKQTLIKMVDVLNTVDSHSEIVILGGWYGSILIPAFKHVKRITLIDKDKDVIGISKNRLFNHYDNIDFICDDVFKWAPSSSRMGKTNLIINTSCEHMRPMKELYLQTNAHFAYQSNNMRDIEGHTNCVSSLNDFKKQLPNNTEVINTHILEDSRGLRFTIIGKYH